MIQLTFFIGLTVCSAWLDFVETTTETKVMRKQIEFKFLAVNVPLLYFLPLPKLWFWSPSSLMVQLEAMWWWGENFLLSPLLTLLNKRSWAEG